MQVLTTSKLIDNIERKGIEIDSKNKRLFKKYNYYQVVNAYKNIFIDGTETIDDIINNINNNKDIERYKKAFNVSDDLSSDEMIISICKCICKKYDRHPKNSICIDDYVKEINEIDYYHHIYSNRVRYSDFVRMYKFEHELRTVLLRYVLIIEESVKNILVSYLNDSKVVDSFLMDINNYKNDSKSINRSIDTIKLILEKQKNKHSKPITRKKFQKINIPYWIIINELTIKETLMVINNLNNIHYHNIYSECIDQFTNISLDNLLIKDSEKNKYIDKMRDILDIIANFRNLLAHNQPLYLFNVNESRTNSLDNISYFYPNANNKNTMNSDTMSMLAKFFGSDRYNSRTQNVNVDLSWIIYIIYKIISILDKNNTLYDEVVNVYKKYSIVNMNETVKINDFTSLKRMLNSVDKFINYDFNSKEIIEQIDSTSKYRALLKHKGVEIQNYQNEIKKYRNNINIIYEKPKYNMFQFLNRYTKYTGIDKNFFDKLK